MAIRSYVSWQEQPRSKETVWHTKLIVKQFQKISSQILIETEKQR